MLEMIDAMLHSLVDKDAAVAVPKNCDSSGEDAHRLSLVPTLPVRSAQKDRCASPMRKKPDDIRRRSAVCTTV